LLFGALGMAYRTSIDIHGMNAYEAEIALEDFLDLLDDDIQEVEVIHGYKSGTVLRDMVRSSFHHHRIKKKIISMNQGITVFLT